MTSRNSHRRAAASALILVLAALPAHPQGARKNRGAQSPAQTIAVAADFDPKLAQTFAEKSASASTTARWA
ncbi:MAG TPA: hypothetical protein VN256_13650 [Pyrinomonadaceae bacterium]|nr:hypothetical protein [Pyrinomonadaceae bacterium]